MVGKGLALVDIVSEIASSVSGLGLPAPFKCYVLKVRRQSVCHGTRKNRWVKKRETANNRCRVCSWATEHSGD